MNRCHPLDDMRGALVVIRKSKHKMSGLRSDHLLSARASFLRASMPILSSVDVPFVAIMLHGHEPSRLGKYQLRFYPVVQATSSRRALKTLENFKPAFRYSLCVPSE